MTLSFHTHEAHLLNMQRAGSQACLWRDSRQGGWATTLLGRQGAAGSTLYLRSPGSALRGLLLNCQAAFTAAGLD